jgi:hypothetical protein
MDTPTQPDEGFDPPPPTTMAAWRILLRGAGVIGVLFVFCFWAAKGYHTGWSQSQVPVKQLDPITEIEFTTYEKRFIPGLDYLGAGTAVGLALFAATFFRRRGPNRS